MPRATRKILLTLLFLAIIAGGLLFSLHALAQEPQGTITVDDLGLEPVREELGMPDTDIRLIAARIIRVALGMLGIIALVLILYGGYTWMTAGGNEEKIQKAKKILLNAVIGLVIILSAYAIVSFVINSLIGATTGGGGGGGGGGGPGAFSKVFYITSMPGDDLGCGIRNIHPVIVFNKPVNLETVVNNLVIRKKSDGSPANGEWHFAMPTAQNRIVFDPIGDCGVEPPQNDCLEASTTYQIYFANPSNIESQDDLSLNCNVGNYKNQCNNNPPVEFTTGSDVDTEPPTITIINPFEGQSFAQGSVIPVELQYTDNFGLQNVGLFVNGDEVNTIAISGCQKTGSVTLNWPSGNSPTGTHALSGVATDNANFTASTTRNIQLLPAHCYDNELNFGETQVGPPACGDGCGNCPGESCTQNSDCASGWCEGGVCVDRMRIDNFSPIAGAVSTTYASIFGQYFGDDGGHVYFRKSGTGDDIWTEAYVVNCGAGIDNWTPSQLVVKVPANAISGPIKVITASTTGADDIERVFTDVTDNDGWGINQSFTVNNELLPGLCALQPNFGSPYSDTLLLGENFGSSQNNPDTDKVYFSSSTALIRPGTWAANTVMVRVPALGTGAVPVKITNDGKESNSVRYYIKETLDSNAPMIESINPENGAKGEYITVVGKNFGSLLGKVLFKLNGTGEAVYGDFNFPDACEGSVWTDNRIIVKFPDSGVTVGNKYSVQVQRATDSAIGPIGAEFSLQSGDPAPGICKIEPPEGPVPFGLSSVMNIYGEYYLRGGAQSRPYFWQTGAEPDSVDGRVATPDGNMIGLNDTWAQLKPPTSTETGPVVMYRSSDTKMGNSLPFTVFNCVENDNTCADPAYKCCTGGGDAGICKPESDLCDGETRSTNYIWRFNTGPFPPTAYVVERCDASTDAGQNLPSPSPSIRWTSGGNFDHFNVCRSALVNIEFSMKMLASTVNSSNIEIYKCASDSIALDVNYQANSCTHVAGPLTLTSDSYNLYVASGDEFSTHDYMQARLATGNWEDNTYYHVVLKPGIKSQPMTYEFGGETRYLDSRELKATRPCGEGTSYCFIFKTDERICRLNKVIVTPYKYWTSVLEAPIKYRSVKSNSDDPGSDLYYRGSGLSDQHCIMMDMSDYDWAWSTYPTAPILYADTWGAPTGTNGNMTQISSLANTVAIGLEDDSALVRAEATKEGEHPANSISGLVGWWKLDETGGSTAEDSSGFNNDGVANGTLGNISFVPGKNGNALNLINTAWFETGYSGFSTGYGSRTLCAWGKPSSLASGFRWVYSYGSPSNGHAMFIGMNGTSLYGGGFGNDIILPSFWQLNTWSHVCLVYDGIAKRGYLYGNGTLRTQQNRNWDLIPSKAYIGEQVFPDPLSRPEFWRGSIDDIRVYSRALTPDEVALVYDYGNTGSVSSGESVIGESPLTIDLSNPKVVDYWPNCLEACTNAEIGAKFNVIMANKNFSNAIKLEKCLDENCLAKESVAGLSKILNPGDRRIIQITFTDTATELAPDTIYQVTLSKTSTSTADSIYQLWSGASLIDWAAFSKPMQEVFTWRFRTKKEKCTLDSVNVVPQIFTAVYVNDRQVYAAEARSAPDACDPKGQRLNPWTIDWSWKSSSSSIATTTMFKTRGHSPFCESNCVKNGSDIAYGADLIPLCGNGVIEAGEDCDPPEKNADIVRCSLSCLRPGNSASNCGNGVVEPLFGEECDVNDPVTKTGCATNCTRSGSNQATGAEEIGASICGNGTLGFGEECDLGVPANYLSSTSSLNCTANCLHAGTQLSAVWCATNTVAFGGFSGEEYLSACAKSVSQCGDGISSPDEDMICEPVAGTLNSNCTTNCLANSLAVKKCSPTTTKMIGSSLAVVKNEGCSAIGQYEGSSLMYSTPSLCGDFSVGIGEDPACEQDFVISHSLFDPWTLARGIGLGSPAGTGTPMQIADITGTGKQTINSIDYIKSDSGEFRILCGYQTDAECQSVAGSNYGVAGNSCCYPKPSIISRYPAIGAVDVCPNTYIEAVFNRYIDPATLTGNVMIARGYYIPDPSCPEGQDDVTALFGSLAMNDAKSPWYQRVWSAIARWFKKIFLQDATAGSVNIYCLANDIGTPEVISTQEWGAYTTTTVLIHLKSALATSTDYAILLRDGIKDSLGVSIGRITDWKFTTGEKICEINNVAINPPEYMFMKANQSEKFFASTTAQNGQLIQPVDGYRWEYEWGPAQSEFINVDNTTSSFNFVTSKNRSGEVTLTASTMLVENTVGAADDVYTGTSDITVFICENPWPSTSSAAFPFKDVQYDFSTYYCRDSGTAGFGDDFPFMTTTAYFELGSSQYLRRYIFTNNDNKDAIGIQIFPNGKHLSVSDWYASEGFRGTMRSMKIDGYDAITDGNNYYIDALKARTPYPTSNYNRYYTNIYQFSINSDAKSETREVFEQMISNLKFNLEMTNNAYCADDLQGNNIDYNLSCNNDLDCLSQIDAIKISNPTSTASQYVCMNLKDKLQRNLARLKDLRGMVESINYGRGAIAVWPMDAVNYAKTPDITNNGFEGVLTGGDVSLAGGMSGQALKIDSSAYAEVKKATNIGNRSFTVALWVKTTSTSGVGANNDLITNCYFGNGFRVGLDSGTREGKLTALIGHGPHSSSASYDKLSCSASPIINDGNWHHIAVVFDRESTPKKIIGYVDGINVCMQAMSANAHVGMFEGGGPYYMRIGQNQATVPGSRIFRGSIDDARIYARMLTQNEISSLYGLNLPYKGGYPIVKENTYLSGQAISTWTNAWGQLNSEVGSALPVDPINTLAKSGSCYKPNSSGQYKACYKDSNCAPVPTEKILSYWSGDYDTIDEGPLQNHAAIEGTVGTVPGKGHGKAFEFQGEADAKVVAAPHTSYYQYLSRYPLGGFGVSAWIYPTKKNTAIIIKKGGSDESGNSVGGFVLEYSGFQWNGSQERFNNGTIRFAIFPTSTDSGKYYFVDSAAPLALNQWHHVVATINKVSAVSDNYYIGLYIDGSVASTNIFKANKTGGYSSVASATMVPENSIIEIGSAFNGIIDNIGYYSPYLSTYDITNLNEALCIEHDPATGWSSEDRRFLFACNTSSYAYRYSYVTTTQSFILRTKLESFTNSLPINWTSFVKDYTSGLVDYSNGICAYNDEIASPYSNVCGDGVIGLGEECDPPGKISYDTSFCPAMLEKAVCQSNCKWPAMWLDIPNCREAAGGSCGDGKIQTLAGEVCDDGALNGTEGRCNTNCTGTIFSCGNGALDPGEFCDTSEELGKCVYRDGVSFQLDPNAKEPIFYFLVDLTGTMGSLFPGAPSPGTRVAMIKYSLPLIAEQFSNPGSRAKIGIGSYNCPVNSFHNKNWMSGTKGYYSSAQVATAISTMVQQNGQNTDSLFDWVRTSIYPILNSGEDAGKPINLVYITDGGKSGSCTPQGASCPDAKIAGLYNDYNITTHVVGVGNMYQCDLQDLADAGHGQYFQITSGADALVEAMMEIYKRPCEQYAEYSGYSCNWNCTGFGGYCGDGILDLTHEECEENKKVSCTTGGGQPGFQECNQCVLGDCVAEASSGGSGSCGNGIIEESEACDRGSENGLLCDPSPYALPLNLTGQCTYCSYDCKNVITRDAVPCTSHTQCSSYQCKFGTPAFCWPPISPPSKFCTCTGI